MKKFFVTAALGLSLFLPGCTTDANVQRPDVASSSDPNASESQSAELFAMDTVMTLTAYGSSAQPALDAASAEIERLDSLFSISSDSGDIKPLNEAKSGQVSDDTAALLARALEVSASTDGIFDCTIAPVMNAWGFPTGDFHVPGKEELASLLSRVDYRQIQISGDTVTLPEGVEIDLGGIAKGYASDRVMQVFAENGVKSGLISLGGNVQTLGAKPDGSRWRIAVQDPVNAEETFAVVEVENEAVITSGGYQRYFEQDGVHYHHIIDPRTGYPAQNGILSSTIVSTDGTLADGLSTSLFIMGLEQAKEYWQAHRDAFDAILMTDDGQVYITEGLEGRCTLTDGSIAQVIRG